MVRIKSIITYKRFVGFYNISRSLTHNQNIIYFKCTVYYNFSFSLTSYLGSIILASLIDMWCTYKFNIFYVLCWYEISLRASYSHPLIRVNVFAKVFPTIAQEDTLSGSNTNCNIFDQIVWPTIKILSTLNI